MEALEVLAYCQFRVQAGRCRGYHKASPHSYFGFDDIVQILERGDVRLDMYEQTAMCQPRVTVNFHAASLTRAVVPQREGTRASLATRLVWERIRCDLVQRC
jgi:hypothetical protein